MSEIKRDAWIQKIISDNRKVKNDNSNYSIILTFVNFITTTDAHTIMHNPIRCWKNKQTLGKLLNPQLLMLKLTKHSTMNRTTQISKTNGRYFLLLGNARTALAAFSVFAPLMACPSTASALSLFTPPSYFCKWRGNLSQRGAKALISQDGLWCRKHIRLPGMRGTWPSDTRRPRR